MVAERHTKSVLVNLNEVYFRWVWRLIQTCVKCLSQCLYSNNNSDILIDFFSLSKKSKKLCLNLHIWMETWIYVIFLYGPNVPSLVDPEWKPVYKVTQPVKSLTCVHASFLPSSLSLSFLSYFQLCLYHQSVIIKHITASNLCVSPTVGHWYGNVAYVGIIWFNTVPCFDPAMNTLW